MRNSIVCDIDGCILQCPYWDTVEDFYQHIDECVPIDWVVSLVKGLHAQKRKIIFLTARDAKCRSYTLYQLKQLFDFPIELYMRQRFDLRPDHEIKKEYMLEIMEKYNVLACIDDNIKNCEMYKSLGLPYMRIVQ